MTAREMLELAAKAAGYDVRSDGEGGLVIPTHRGACRDWDPINNDGDALRLAVQLGFVVEPGRCWHSPYGPVFSEDVLIGVMTATRRAITRAAAEIGRGM